MALWSQYFSCLLFVLLLHPLGNTAFDAIYQFGDSGSDTGNLIREKPVGCSSPPYGETVLFHRPTGRCSDGFLIVDFLAKAFLIPLLNPYLERDANFIHGVDFSVAGSTALDASFFALMDIALQITNSSLRVQLEWFKTHLKSNICSSKEECKHRFGKTLFILGPTGGNDYTNVLSGGLQAGYKLVPEVIHMIKDAINEVIDDGASHVVVPGYFNLGCYPSVLANVASNDASLYDEFNCLKVLNDFTKYHNLKLQESIKELQHQHPSVSISYGDFYSAFAWVLQNAASLGFEKDEVLKACCGDGNNAYNYNVSRFCGTPGVSSCPDPKTRVFWDGIHLTHQAYNYMASWLLEHNFRAI